MITYLNYNQFVLDNFNRIPNEISIKNGNDILQVEDFNDVFHSSESREAKNIIYIWRTEKKIPRLKGESNIIYIGQTSKSLFQRHGSAKVKATSKANKQKFNDIVSMYGPITVSYIKLKDFDPSGELDLLKAEGQFLWWYFQNHSEYPPNNYTKTKIRNDVVDINVFDYHLSSASFRRRSGMGGVIKLV